jgi:hypothetical protein
VTLTRLVLAWIPVTLVFLLGSGPAARREAPEGLWGFTRADLAGRSAEAAVATLFGALWFASLGHGGWWLLFFLVGLLVALARYPDPTSGVSGTREATVRAVRDMVRYLAAGAILAWALG